MERYVCTICGHVYDPEKGEPRLDLPAGKEFAALRADWQCPVCFAEKAKFVRV